MKYLLSLIVFFICVSAKATTWDEPWHDQVVKNATSFSQFIVEKNDDSGLTLKLIKSLAGDATEKRVKVSGFYLYDLQSYSSHDEEDSFSYKKGDTIYVFLKKEKGKYLVATPTAGFDEVLSNGQIAATYRISAHKSQMDQLSYEETQTCIFENLHGRSCSQKIIEKYIKEPLSSEKVGMLSENASNEDATLFFRQHVAMEMSYLIHYSLDQNTLDRFLSCPFAHVQISAVRAMFTSSELNIEEKYANYIVSENGADISKVMAILMLKKINYKSVESRLLTYLPKSSEKSVFLFGSIMDPRVGTFYPNSVMDAIKWLYEVDKK